jgi:hypothetical protein
VIEVNGLAKSCSFRIPGALICLRGTRGCPRPLASAPDVRRGQSKDWPLCIAGVLPASREGAAPMQGSRTTGSHLTPFAKAIVKQRGDLPHGGVLLGTIGLDSHGGAYRGSQQHDGEDVARTRASPVDHDCQIAATPFRNSDDARAGLCMKASWIGDGETSSSHGSLPSRAAQSRRIPGRTFILSSRDPRYCVEFPVNSTKGRRRACEPFQFAIARTPGRWRVVTFG